MYDRWKRHTGERRRLLGGRRDKALRGRGFLLGVCTVSPAQCGNRHGDRNEGVAHREARTD